MAKKPEKSLARGIGKTFACLQDTIDVFCSWFFFKLKKFKLNENDRHKGKKFLKKTTNKTLNFLGDVGKSFYEEYEKLKEKKSKRNHY